MLDIPPEREMADCCVSGDITRVAELLKYGVRPDGAVGPRTFLGAAIEASRADIVQLLLRSGARATAADLVRAIRAGDVRIADRIVDELELQGIEYDFWTDERPLLTDPAFIGKARLDIVRWMLGRGADPLERDRFGNDAVAAARRVNGSEELVALLTNPPR